jgi:hypothetical protein
MLRIFERMSFARHDKDFPESHVVALQKQRQLTDNVFVHLEYNRELC